jgi:hypothetical protein
MKYTLVSLAFKSFHADFIKRPESDVYFICEEGAKVRDLVQRTLACEDRLGEMVKIQASVRAEDGSFDPVAEFTLELTLKRSSKGTI